MTSSWNDQQKPWLQTARQNIYHKITNQTRNRYLAKDMTYYFPNCFNNSFHEFRWSMEKQADSGRVLSNHPFRNITRLPGLSKTASVQIPF